MKDLERLVRRLRGFSPRSWRTGERSETVRRLAANLVAIGGEGHLLPEIPDYALPDVIAVVGADALAIDPTAAAALIAEGLGQTR